MVNITEKKFSLVFSFIFTFLLSVIIFSSICTPTAVDIWHVDTFNSYTKTAVL